MTHPPFGNQERLAFDNSGFPKEARVINLVHWQLVTAEVIIGSFRLDDEYEIECEYDFRILNQWRFQSPRSSYWF